MQRIFGFTVITKIEISMGFHTFKLDSQSQRLYIMSTAFGLFKYKRLHTGIDNSLDFFWPVLHTLFADL